MPKPIENLLMYLTGVLKKSKNILETKSSFIMIGSVEGYLADAESHLRIQEECDGFIPKHIENFWIWI